MTVLKRRRQAAAAAAAVLLTPLLTAAPVGVGQAHGRSVRHQPSPGAAAGEHTAAQAAPLQPPTAAAKAMATPAPALATAQRRLSPPVKLGCSLSLQLLRANLKVQRHQQQQQQPLQVVQWGKHRASRHTCSQQQQQQQLCSRKQPSWLLYRWHPQTALLVQPAALLTRPQQRQQQQQPEGVPLGQLYVVYSSSHLLGCSACQGQGRVLHRTSACTHRGAGSSGPSPFLSFSTVSRVDDGNEAYCAFSLNCDSGRVS